MTELEILSILIFILSLINFSGGLYICSDIQTLKDENRKLKDELHFLEYKIKKPPNKASNVQPAPPKKVKIIIRKRGK